MAYGHVYYNVKGSNYPYRRVRLSTYGHRLLSSSESSQALARCLYTNYGNVYDNGKYYNLEPDRRVRVPPTETGIGRVRSIL